MLFKPQTKFGMIISIPSGSTSFVLKFESLLRSCIFLAYFLLPKYLIERKFKVFFCIFVVYFVNMESKHAYMFESSGREKSTPG